MLTDLTILFDEIEKRGMTIASFAKKTGIPVDRIYQWKNKRGHPKTKDAEKIQQFLSEPVAMEPQELYAKKLTAVEASVAVLMQRVSYLLSKANHSAEIVELKRIEQDAQSLRQMQG